MMQYRRVRSNHSSRPIILNCTRRLARKQGIKFSMPSKILERSWCRRQKQRTTKRRRWAWVNRRCRQVIPITLREWRRRSVVDYYISKYYVHSSERSFYEGSYVFSVFIGHAVPKLAEIVFEEIVALDCLDVGFHLLGDWFVVELSVAWDFSVYSKDLWHSFEFICSEDVLRVSSKDVDLYKKIFTSSSFWTIPSSLSNLRGRKLSQMVR